MTEAVEIIEGKKLDARYTLLDKLGAGGQGEVWRAHDGTRGVDIALKVVTPAPGREQGSWSALEHEYAIASKLDHPSILKVFPPEKSGDLFILPMELASGGDLRRLRGAGFLEIIPVLLEIAQALEHAHERGVVHRDLKPGNVLFDARGRARLADFGVAEQALTAAELNSPGPAVPATRDTNRHGFSPFTASPAQLRGEPPAPADDIYGLGALAYELLSGYPPYYPHFDRKRAMEERVPTLVPTRQIPPLLGSLVMNMLAKDPKRRPRTMREVIDELDAAINDTLTYDFDNASPATPTADVGKQASAVQAAPKSDGAQSTRGGDSAGLAKPALWTPDAQDRRVSRDRRGRRREDLEPPADQRESSAPPDRREASPPPDRREAGLPPDRHEVSPPLDRHEASPPPDRHEASPPPDRRESNPPLDVGDATVALPLSEIQAAFGSEFMSDPESNTGGDASAEAPRPRQRSGADVLARIDAALERAAADSANRPKIGPTSPLTPEEAAAIVAAARAASSPQTPTPSATPPAQGRPGAGTSSFAGSAFSRAPRMTTHLLPPDSPASMVPASSLPPGPTVGPRRPGVESQQSPGLLAEPQSPSSRPHSSSLQGQSGDRVATPLSGAAGWEPSPADRSDTSRTQPLGSFASRTDVSVTPSPPATRADPDATQMRGPFRNRPNQAATQSREFSGNRTEASETKSPGPLTNRADESATKLRGLSGNRAESSEAKSPGPLTSRADESATKLRGLSGNRAEASEAKSPEPLTHRANAFATKSAANRADPDATQTRGPAADRSDVSAKHTRVPFADRSDTSATQSFGASDIRPDASATHSSPRYWPASRTGARPDESVSDSGAHAQTPLGQSVARDEAGAFQSSAGIPQPKESNTSDPDRTIVRASASQPGRTGAHVGTLSVETVPMHVNWDIPLDGLPKVARLEPIKPRRWPWVFLGVLAGAAAAVYFWLPRFDTQALPPEVAAVVAPLQTAISQSTASQASPTPTAPNTDASGATESGSVSGHSPESAARVTAATNNTVSTATDEKRLHDMRQVFDARVTALEARGAGVWGGREFAMAKTRAAESVGANDAGNPRVAQERLAAAMKLLDAVDGKAAQALSSQVTAGEKALGAGQQEVAGQAFDLARRINPADRRASDGLRRAQNLNAVLPLLADAENAESAHDYARAAQDYSQALSLDPSNTTAKAGQSRANAAFGDDNYAKAVGAGFAALGAGRLDEAHEAFTKARALKPNGAEASEGLRRVGAALSARGFASMRQRAAGLEAQERWDEAERVYEDVLAADPSLAFAQEGKARTASRADLSIRLQQLLDRPDRLATPSVRDDASALLETARAQSPQGPVIRSQIARLELLLPSFDKPVRLSLLSDNSTQVVIPSIGSFGAFARRDIELRPGKYTVVGTRNGFRDVRREITVAPGQETQTIRVTCSDPI